MFDVKVSGLKEVQDRMKKLQQNMKELDGENQIPLDELMTDGFVKKHIGHDTFEGFVIESRLLSEGKEITEEILNSDEFNDYVDNNTDFDSWQNMLKAASVEYIQKQLGF